MPAAAAATASRDSSENDRWKELVHEAVRGALVNLDAAPAPAGTMTVVLGPGWPGMLLHEAIGHGLEGDFNRKGTSAFSGRIGEQVAASEHAPSSTTARSARVAARSTSTTKARRPSCTTLIENGVLRGYLQDKLNARLMGVAPTGNGRRESFAHMTLPRMTNTYMLAGKHDPQEIIGSVQKGLYCKNFGGGQVDITSGKFVFSASEAYLIENGKLTAPVRGATLIGNGPDVLRRVSMVGNDLKLDEGVGTCGKEGQDVPVGVGQPTLRIDGMTVGGTAALDAWIARSQSLLRWPASATDSGHVARPPDLRTPAVPVHARRGRSCWAQPGSSRSSTLPSVFLVVGRAEPHGGTGAVAAAAGLPHAPVRVQQPVAGRLDRRQIGLQPDICSSCLRLIGIGRDRRCTLLPRPRQCPPWSACDPARRRAAAALRRLRLRPAARACATGARRNT